MVPSISFHLQLYYISLNVKHSMYIFGSSEVCKTTCTSIVAKSCCDIPGSSWEWAGRDYRWWASK